MKEKKQTIESVAAEEIRAPETYRTGSTCPPKSRGGLIAFLLVLVIFLSGIVTALSLMNIHLFRQLSSIEQTDPSPVIFSAGTMERQETLAVNYPLGFAGQEVSDFWQTYHGLPAGIYVVEITGSDVRDILPGDILIRIDGKTLYSGEDFRSILNTYRPGDLIEAVLYRGGEEVTATLIMQED